jgi:DNA-binding CsgD family transcriptional regulator
MWATPQAQKLLSDALSADGDDDVVLPDPIPQWLDQARKGNAGSKAVIMTALPGNEQLRLQYMGRLGSNEFLLRLAKDSGAETPSEFSSELGLTTREGEVLSWLSKGKTNRDIAQILGLSPRTVDKHLEQIYSKLGVENRTAAAAIAVNAKHRKS